MDRNAGAILDVGTGVAHVLDALGVTGPVEMLMLVEDPGAANFAAGLLPVLSPHGPVTVHARGQGAAQLARLGVNAVSLDDPFDAAALLARSRPGLIFVGTSEDCNGAAHELVRICRAGQVPTVGFVDGAANVDRRFRGVGGTPLAFAPDVVLVPAVHLRTHLVAAGLAPDRVFAVTHPHLARLAADRWRFEGISLAALRQRLFPACKERPVLVFLAERSSGLDAADFRRSPQYTLAGRGGDDRRTNIVLEEVLDAVSGLEPRPFVVLRLHPKNDATSRRSRSSMRPMLWSA